MATCTDLNSQKKMFFRGFYKMGIFQGFLLTLLNIATLYSDCGCRAGDMGVRVQGLWWISTFRGLRLGICALGLGFRVASRLLQGFYTKSYTLRV